MNLEGYYNSIDEMLLYNWIKCTSGEIKYVRKGEKGNVVNDKLVWEKIYDSYLKEYGLSPAYKKLLNEIKQKTLLEIDYVITKDRFKLTQIELSIVKLENMLSNNGSGMTIQQTLIHFSKWLGSWVDAKNITVRDYFNLLKEYGKENKV